jgi:hypothetical protein
MENKISEYGQNGPEQEREKGPADDVGTMKTAQDLTPVKEQKVTRPPTPRRARIRAYQKIDYWQ